MLQRRRRERAGLRSVLLLLRLRLVLVLVLVLVDDSDRRVVHRCVLQMIVRHRLRLRVLDCMVEAGGVLLVRRRRRVDGRWFGRVGEKRLFLEGQLLLSEVAGNVRSIELGSHWFVDLRVGRAVEAVRTNTVQLQTDACRARPCVCRRRVALDFPPSAPLTRPHDYVWASVSASALRPGVGGLGHALFVDNTYPSTACGGCARPRTHSLGKESNRSEARQETEKGGGRCVRTFLGFTRRLLVGWRREREGAHLGRLREQPAR